MEQLALAIFSIAIGVIATLVVSRYYFARSINKSLTPYVQFRSSLFRGVDSSIRDSLKIEYKGTPVDELYEIQFLIANTGDKAIQNIIDPLTLVIPEGCKLLDAALLHVFPEGRTINITSNENFATLAFPLLNKKEFFIVKFLLKGTPKYSDFKFKITADDIPPLILPQLLPYDSISGSTPEKREFNLPSLIGGIVVVIFGITIGSLIYNSWSIVASLWGSGILEFLKNQSFISLSILLSSIPALFLLLLALCSWQLQ